MGFGEVECSLAGDGFPSGGGGFALTTEDMARLGQLYLDKGMWQGEQIVPRAWIEAATVPQSDNSNGNHRDGNEDWEAGYGYQLWQNDPWLSYRFDGAFGQEALVYPAQDLLVICTAATTKIAELFRLSHRFLMNQVVDGALPENPVACKHVQELLANLRLPEAEESGASWLQEKAEGLRLALGKNEVLPFIAGFGQNSSRKAGICALTPAFAEGEMTLTLETPDKTWAILAGMDGEARHNSLEVDGAAMDVWASARWKDQNVLSIACRTLRAVYTLTFDIRYHIGGAEVVVSQTPRGDQEIIPAEMA